MSANLQPAGNPLPVVLKVSGEALAGPAKIGIDPATIGLVADEIVALREAHIPVAVVPGGGNFFRGATLAQGGDIDRRAADDIGMLGTVMNAIALRSALTAGGVDVRVMTALPMHKIAEPHIPARAIRHIQKGRVVIYAAGLGEPYFSTDTAAVQRALEIGAQLVFKCTRVRGVFTSDPMKPCSPPPRCYVQVSYGSAMDLGVLDQTATSQAGMNGVQLVIFRMLDETGAHIAEAVLSRVNGAAEPPGSLIGPYDDMLEAERVSTV